MELLVIAFATHQTKMVQRVENSTRTPLTDSQSQGLHVKGPKVGMPVRVRLCCQLVPLSSINSAIIYFRK